MLKAKDKEARRGNLITFAIVLALTLVTMVLENVVSPGSLLFTVIKKGAVYSLVAVSMNLLNGFTGLFSLGQAGFMLLGAYAYAIFMIPDAARDGVYYLFEGSSIHFSFQEMFQHLFGATGFGGGVSLVLGVLVAIIFAGLVAAFFAYLIGLPVLRLKSDYLAIATLGFAEILRAIFQWQTLGKVTNGANILKGYPTFADFNITNASGKVLFRLSAVVPILLAGICIFLIVLLINSSYGRAFKAIRDDEIAAEAMGVNLAKHKSLSFVISSFFAGVSGALFAMFATTVQAKVFTSAMTYEILLIVVIGGMITSKKVKTTKTNQLMAFVTLEDMVGTVECLIFPKIYEKSKAFLNEDAKVFLRGRVSIGDDPVGKLVCEEAVPFSDIPNELWLQFRNQGHYKETVDAVMAVLRESEGKDRVVMYLREEKAIRRMSENWAVRADASLREALSGILGAENVKVVQKSLEAGGRRRGAARA